jgi:hypothetical protein
MAGIFGSSGVWSLGFDFLANGTPSAGGVFDYVIASGTMNVNPSFARFGIGKGIQCQSGSTYFGKNFNEELSSFITGFAFSVNQLPPSNISTILTAYDNVAGAQVVSLGLNSSGQLQFYQNGGYTPSSGSSGLTSPLGSASTAGTIVAGSYYFIELHIVIGSAGLVECRVNGIVVCTFSGNTQKTNPWATTVFMGAAVASTSNSYDDWYILDLTAPSPLNTYLGPGRVQTDTPTGDSATPGLNAWQATNPVGTDYGNCANIPANTGQYNFSGTIGQRMSLSFPALTGYVQAMFLNTWFSVLEDAAGSRGVTPIFRSNGADQSGVAINLPSSYTVYNSASAIDPNTGNPWADGTISAAQSCEIGLLVSS